MAGTLGSLQAMEAIKLILDFDRAMELSTTTVNLLSLETQQMRWKKSENCPLCSSSARIKAIDQREYQSREDLELTSLNHEDMVLIDIREGHEIEKLESNRLIHWPLSQEGEWSKKLDRKSRYLFICSKGIRSYKLVNKLRLKGMDNCFSLFGGLENYESTLK